MYVNNRRGRDRPWQQDPEENLDAYIRNASYENEHERYSMDERPLYRRPDSPSRQSQAAAGRARLSLPLTTATDFQSDDYMSYTPAAPDPFIQHENESMPFQFPLQQENSSSPGQALTSSPAFQASQRQHNTDISLPIRTHPLSRAHTKVSTSNDRPMVQGIPLVPVHDLPDRFRTIFPFTVFNAVQSGCFESIYGCNDNCVVSSPTGSGKTVLFELAICRLICGWQNGTFKVVYMAPTKSLCSERARDWKTKFGPFNLKCEEMTGDSDVSSLQYVQRADIIVTTPEKWDSMTRKWKDHEKLVRLIKLLLIDEVHILNKDRGAALEVVVSRMKSIGSGTRFVALSATVPNSQDIATWLGRNDDTPTIPAIHKRFGEEFRPVELKRHVCAYQSNTNPFGFDALLTKKLPDVISKYSQKKPIMVFCFTRKSCADTAAFLAQWWQNSTPQDRFWSAPLQRLRVEDRNLLNTVSAGVAVHHAGLSQGDRAVIERAYLSGGLGVICCTSTLAVGVNLPCHMVIIKGTVSYEAGAVKEYSDLEIMQMIGRAGRPQFDSSALAVIMTKLQQVRHYEQLLSGQERLESCLHLNLVEHLNAEIGLGMVTNLAAAKRWLAGTFLKVRLEDNPAHYRIQGDTPERNLSARLEQICSSAISQLKRLTLIETEPTYRATEYGEAMARYYMNIATMELIIDLPQKPKISALLSTISQAYEFKELRLRAGEKQAYKELNDMPDIRFPIKVDLCAPAHKVSLIVQSILGGVTHIADLPTHRTQYNTDQAVIFQHAHRVIRCTVDCQNYRNDAIGIRNSLMLARSLAAKVWDDSPMVLKQIDQIGPVALRKLVGANISSMDELDSIEPGRVELILSRTPPFGWNLLKNVQLFPKLRVSLQMIGKPTIKPAQNVLVKVKVDLGFLNEKTPTCYRSKPVFVIVLVATSDGHKISFFRLSAQKLDRVTPVEVTAALTSPTQLIECYAMCDELAGTMRQATLNPEVPASAFQTIKEKTAETDKDKLDTGLAEISKISKTWEKAMLPQAKATANDEWGDGGINDDDFITAEPNENDFMDIDDIDSDSPKQLAQSDRGKPRTGADNNTETTEAQRLDNGNFACSHPCKDKVACKHMCCKEGLKNKPRPRKPKDRESISGANKRKTPSDHGSKVQSKLILPIKKKRIEGPVEELDLSQAPTTFKTKPPAAITKLTRLHSNTTKANEIPLLGSVVAPQSIFNNSYRKPAFLESLDEEHNDEDLDSMLLADPPLGISGIATEETMLADDNEYLDEDEDMLDAALVGLGDSQMLRDEEQGRMTPRLQPSTMHDEHREKTDLFVTPNFPQHDMSSERNALLDRTNGDLSNESLTVAQREREDGAESSNYFATKRSKVQEHEQSSDGVGKKKSSEREGLEAWLEALLGDSVELKD